MSKKVLILTGDAVEALEVYYPYYRLLEAGYDVVIASPKKKTLHTVIHDFIGWDTFTEKEGYLLQSHASFDEINPEEFDGLVVPGGRAPEYIRLDSNVPRLLNHFFDAGKPVGAICHAVQMLTVIKDQFKDRSLTAYTSCRPDVEGMGATYVQETLHVDGNLVSGHAWPDLPGFMREFIKLMEK